MNSDQKSEFLYVEAFESHRTTLRDHKMPRDRSIDIDTREDFKQAPQLAGGKR